MRSTRCTGSLEKQLQQLVRRSSLPAQRFWKYHFFLRTTCQPGTACLKVTAELLSLFTCVNVKENCVESKFPTNRASEEERHISLNMPVFRQSEMCQWRHRASHKIDEMIKYASWIILPYIEMELHRCRSAWGITGQ